LLENKIKDITKKLVEIGFKRQNFNKPTLENFLESNERKDEMLDKIREISGNDAEKIYEDYHSKILNDYIPDIEFVSNKFNLEIFLEKDLMKITLNGKLKEIDNCNKEEKLELQEILPFKTIGLNNFYVFFIEKGYKIEMILQNSDN